MREEARDLRSVWTWLYLVEEKLRQGWPLAPCLNTRGHAVGSRAFTVRFKHILTPLLCSHYICRNPISTASDPCTERTQKNVRRELNIPHQ